VTELEKSEAWRSYLMPGTNTLRTLAGFNDQVAAALFERITSVDAETTLRKTVDRGRTFDLAHLQDIHRQLFGDVYEWAGQLRCVDLSKSVQSGEPFLHHRWITVCSSAVTDPLQADANLAGQSDPGVWANPGVWADRAAHYSAAMLHAHPFREGNGRSIRIWLEDLADSAGHHLRCERSSADRNVFVAVAPRNGDLERCGRCSPKSPAAPWASIAPSTPLTICTSSSTPLPGRASDWPLAPMKTASSSGRTPRM
jgi:cell filamentation protein, protein adenylyltransferase